MSRLLLADYLMMCIYILTYYYYIIIIIITTLLCFHRPLPDYIQGAQYRYCKFIYYYVYCTSLFVFQILVLRYPPRQSTAIVQLNSRRKCFDSRRD